MLTRRQFIAGSALAAVGIVPLATRLLASAGGSGGFTPPQRSWSVSGASTLYGQLGAVFTTNDITINDGSPQAFGYMPANGVYDALWTRDHAYTIWHDPTLASAAQRREFVDYYISRRTDGSEADPDGGFLPVDWIADRIEDDGTAVFKNAGASELPFMDGIAFVILVLYADWVLTADTTTFDDNEAAINDCLAAIPRSANGCVYSNPAAPSVDYGFTDTILKTGDCTYGTALLAWAYKMLGAISDDPAYSVLRAEAQAGLATLRKSNGFYMGSSGNNATRDDVWATALIVAEGLVSGDDRLESAQALADAYATITQNGLVRHLPTGQTWAGTVTTSGTYQNGGYWLTPVWDCVRAVDLVDPTLADTWAAAAIAEVADEYADEGTVGAVTAPYEWRNGATLSTPKGYTAHAALIKRFV